MDNFTTNDGVELAYLDGGGDGPPLVMLHGWGQTQAMFHHQVAGLAPQSLDPCAQAAVDRQADAVDVGGGIGSQEHRAAYYRLVQIKHITGLDLDDGRHRLLLHMGLLINDLAR